MRRGPDRIGSAHAVSGESASMLLGRRRLSTEQPDRGEVLHDSTAAVPANTIDADRSFAGGALVEIANAIVHLYKQAYGRGPTKARARFLGSDLLVVLLEDNLTVAERNLVALGEFARVREQRLLMHVAFEDQKRAVVERIVQRRVVGAISGIDPRRDVCAEIFTLEPSAENELGPLQDGGRGEGHSRRSFDALPD
jgi:uncharacterized protein YbcI